MITTPKTPEGYLSFIFSSNIQFLRLYTRRQQSFSKGDATRFRIKLCILINTRQGWWGNNYTLYLSFLNHIRGNSKMKCCSSTPKYVRSTNINRSNWEWEKEKKKGRKRKEKRKKKTRNEDQLRQISINSVHSQLEIMHALRLWPTID